MFEKALSVQLSQRDSRTLEAARKSVPKRVGVAKCRVDLQNPYIYVFIAVSLVYTCAGVYVYIRTKQSLCSCVV